jgi:hypothetical protein
LFKATADQFVDVGSGEIVSFTTFGSVICDPVEEHQLGSAVGFYRII